MGKLIYKSHCAPIDEESDRIQHNINIITMDIKNIYNVNVVFNVKIK
jgi:hypothetical protein